MEKKYSNMDIVVPEDWSTNNGLTKEQREEQLFKIQKEIKDKAAKICTRRRELATQLENKVDKLEKKQNQLKDFISAIQRSIVVEENPERREQIKGVCGELLRLMSSYVTSLTLLKNRFSNQKIRILSFGTKNQGKSSFTRAYTNLPKKVVDIKEDGETKDWTGATTIFIHQSGIDANSPNIRVVFKRPQSIVDTVNYCFQRLGLNYHYETWEQLYLVLKKEDIDNSNIEIDPNEDFKNDKKKNLFYEIDNITLSDESMTDLSEVKSTLLNIFKAQSDFSDIDEGNESYFNKDYGKPISLDSLSEYNNMQNPNCQKYMSVSEIHVFADLKHNDMFENIEVCDTKGTSVDAGGEEYEKELYSIIGSSDAIFSIQMTGNQAVGDSDKGFYIRLNKYRNQKGYKESLKHLDLRHFAIINIYDQAQKNCFDGVFRVLNDNRIVNTAYAGILKEGAKYDGVEYHIQDFVDYVIHDMMKKIVVTTNTTDQKLLEDTKSLENDITLKQKELIKQLAQYDIPIQNEEEIIHDSIGRWILDVGMPSVKNAIINVAKKEGVPISFNEDKADNYNQQKEHTVGMFDDEYEEEVKADSTTNKEYAPTENIVYEESQLGDIKQGIYEIITGESKIPSELNGKSAKDVVEGAILNLFNRIKGNIGKKKWHFGYDIKGTWENIGSYIDDASILISREIQENVNRKFAPDKKLPNSQSFKDVLFTSVWDCLKLNLLYKGFDGSILEKKDNTNKLENCRLENWSIPYNLSANIPSSSPLLPPPSFVILKYYFDSVQKDYKVCDDYGQVAIKEDLLIKAFQKAYLYYDLPTRYRLKKNEAFKWKTELCQHLWNDVNDSESFSKEMIDLYKYVCPNEFVDKLTEAQIIDETIKELCENQKRLKELQNQRRNLSGFSI